MTQRRCTECRKWFTPQPSARTHQHVCGAACRRVRRRKLARYRRLDDLVEQRTDERLRQRKHRDAAKGVVRHAPASDAKQAELLSIVEQIVDKVARVSRATLLGDVRRMLREIAIFAASGVDEARPRHEPPSAPEELKIPSRSVPEVDGVTDRAGS
jgi:hypothetical protein